MKDFIGRVVANKMLQTVVVERTILYTHPLYKKQIRRRRRLKAHTTMELNVGDVVKLQSTRPLSRDKHFRVVGKIEGSRKL